MTLGYTDYFILMSLDKNAQASERLMGKKLSHTVGSCAEIVSLFSPTLLVLPTRQVVLPPPCNVVAFVQGIIIRRRTEAK
jgi:hypothetical protein